MGRRHRKIDTGNIGNKTQKNRHGYHWAQDRKILTWVTLGTRHKKIERGSIGHKTQKHRHGNIGHKIQKDRRE